MKTGTTDSGIVKMNDGSEIQIRLRHQGFFPKDLEDRITESIAESIHTYLRDSNYRFDRLKENTKLLTEVLEMELDEIAANFPDVIRYTNITCDREQLFWAMEVHLEEASAACRVSLEMSKVKVDG